MSYADASGVKLYYEEAGSGTPVLFVHEFAGDHRSWEPQMRHFARTNRAIAYSARGYPPSDVPDDLDLYGQDIARDDILAVMDHLVIERAHIVGLSMGGFAAVHFGIHYPERALSLVVSGCGYGAPKGAQGQFRDEVDAMARRFREDDFVAAMGDYAEGPTRVQFQNKDPRGWAEFKEQLQEHSAIGAANTFSGVQGRRPSLYDLEAELSQLQVPTLLVIGDEDDPCLDANAWMKRTIPSSGLVIIPRSGHTINLEEPALFNAAVADFIATVEAGRWGLRDPRSTTGGIVTKGPGR